MNGVSNALIARVHAFPGTTICTAFAALGGSRESIGVLLRDAVRNGFIFDDGTQKGRAFFATEHLASAAQIDRRRNAQTQPRIRRLLCAAPAGVTNRRIRELTGFSAIQVSDALSNLSQKSLSFTDFAGRCSLHFSTAELMALAKAARLSKPKIIALAPRTWPKSAPIKPAACIRATPRTGPRTGWGPDDPMTITDATRVTRYPTHPMGLRTNTHSQF